MKSTKKIFAVALAAMMLFAFTACNNTMPSAFKSVEYVEVQQIESYLKGETPKASGFQVVVNYTEGEPTVLKGSTGTIAFDSATDAKLAAVADGIEFLDKGGHPVVAVPAEIAYEEVTSVTIEGIEEYTVETSTDDPWTLSDFDYNDEALKDMTVTLAGGDASRTYTIQDKLNDKIDFVLSLWKDGKILEEGDSVAVGDTYTVTFDKYRYAATGEWEADFTNGDKNPGLETGITVSVVEKETPAPNPTKNDVTALRVKWAIDAKEVGTENSLTAYAGQKVSYVIVGVVGDKEVSLSSADYKVTGTIPTTSALTADNITDDAQPAYTATVEFISNEGAGNWEAGSVAPITLTLTVKDAINPANLTSATFTYADKVIAGTAVTLDPAKFTATVKTFDGKDAKLVGTAIKDKDTYAASEVVAGSPLPVRIKWVTADDTYLHYEGYANTTVAVEPATT